MKLDFDTENIRKNDISLLDCQVDLILRSLELYLHVYKFIYPRRKESETKEENLRKSLVFNTYQQILNEYNESKCSNPIEPNLRILDTQKNKLKLKNIKIS